ncbi:MAG: T9SS type A sorting domain-containing protein [Bacteroidota bacterium]
MRYWIFVFLMILFAYDTSGQLRQLPIAHKVNSSSIPTNARLQAATPITLPFWDDFSQSSSMLDTAWWMPGSQAQILSRPGNGVLPPTLNVVTFDGVDANGNPYSALNTDGPVDSLVSRPIDLTQVPQHLQGTVYLSFFFQKGGLGNQPEPNDSLQLFFLKSDTTWQKMWPLVGDNIPDDPTIFTEKLVHVPDDTIFFHENFQFMFKAIGRQNGWFDNWNIDYIYMDKRRHASDNSYLDRAITDYPTSILNGYTAIPFNEFTGGESLASKLSSSSTWIRSLEDDIQPVEYSAIIYDTLNNIVIDTIADLNDMLLFAYDIKEAATDIPDTAAFDITADSLFLEIEYFVRTGDKFLVDSIYNANADTAFYSHINLRVNDTIRSYATIHDYFAYDDGSAEFGAGINQRDGRIAYEFYTNNAQYLDRVDFYFPNVSRNQAGSPIEVCIYKDLEDSYGSNLGFITGAIEHNGINNFVSYNFSPAINVKDTFYVVLKNLADDGLWTAIGLDKNTNTGEKIYYNVEGSWAKNTFIEGSLMIRPYFGDGTVTGIGEEINAFQIYPNPVKDRLIIEGEFDHIEVVDLMGKQVNFRLFKEEYRSELLFHNPGRQLVFLILEKGGKTETHKLLISH